MCLGSCGCRLLLLRPGVLFFLLVINYGGGVSEFGSGLGLGLVRAFNWHACIQYIPSWLCSIVRGLGRAG